MRKGAVCVVAMVLASVFILASADSQEDMVNVDSSAFENPQRELSIFRHDEHNETAEIEECNECHHIYEDGKKVEDESSEDQMCSDCHELKSSNGRPSLRKAFHGNCMGCHRKGVKGPVMCGECHVKS